MNRRDLSGNPQRPPVQVPEKFKNAFNKQLLPLEKDIQAVLESNLTPEQKKQKQDAIRKGLVSFLDDIGEPTHPHLNILKQMIEGSLKGVPPVFQPPR